MQGTDIPVPDADIARQREVVDAFFAAGRTGDFDSLIKILDPDVVLRADLGPGRPPVEYRGVTEVARLAHAPAGAEVHRVLVNGQLGGVVTIDGQPHSVLAFRVVNGKIVEIDSISDPERVSRITAAVLPGKE